VRSTTLRLGSRDVDVDDRPVVMGVLDVESPGVGGDLSLDDLVRRAGRLVDGGADLLDLELVGRAVPEVDEELDVVARAVEALVARLDVPLSVAASGAAVARAAFGAGAVMANDRTGRGDATYLAAVAECGATLVAGPGGRVDSGPAEVVEDVRAALLERVGRARSAGIPADRIVLDAGLGQGGPARRALALLRASDRFVELGYPVLLSADDATFVGAVPGLEDGGGQVAASLAAASLGTTLGCRVVRTRDVAVHHQVCAVLAAVNRASR
jgi:dihydropteroate synthase